MRFLVTVLVVLGFLGETPLQAQTPAHFFHTPANAGVNNLFFHAINGRMVFILTQAELASMGVTANKTLGSIWFRHNVAQSTVLSNFTITLGHTSLAAPVTNFANNFNAGTPVTVLNAASYSYSSNAGAWNSPTANWTEIPLTNFFTYNGINNLAIQIQFSGSSNSLIGFYASNGAGTPLTQWNSSRNATVASATTTRPMVGFSEGAVLFFDQEEQTAGSDTRPEARGWAIANTVTSSRSLALYPGDGGIGYVRLVNLKGQRVMEGRYDFQSGEKVTLSMPECAPGVYVLHIIGKGYWIRRRISIPGAF